MFNDHAGFGVKDDTFEVLSALRRAGEEAWFQVGDRDFATHLLRSQMLSRGSSLTETSLELCRRFALKARVIPMSDDIVRTRFETDDGVYSFQEYFVRERLQPKLRGITFATPAPAHATREVADALRGADRVIIGPSNPLISVDPILRLTRELMPRDRTIAVTPIVEGGALKGPTVEMMRAMGFEPSPVEVARRYADIATCFVLDERDRDLRPAVEALGYRVIVCDTVMRDGGRTLARAVVGA